MDSGVAIVATQTVTGLSRLVTVFPGQDSRSARGISSIMQTYILEPYALQTLISKISDVDLARGWVAPSWEHKKHVALEEKMFPVLIRLCLLEIILVHAIWRRMRY